MTDHTQTPPSSPDKPTTPTTTHHKPHITWSDPYSKALHAIEALSAIFPSLPPTLSSSESPAAALLHDPDVSTRLSNLLRRPDSGAVEDALCAWLYDTFHSSEPDLHLVVLRFIPTLAGVYLSRVALHKPLAGFESVLLAIYAHETAARAGQAVTASIPDLAHPSVYHEANKQSPSKNGSTELHLAVISPSLEPHGTVRSTRRARIVGVALELFYSNIWKMPVGSKIEFCEFCKIWAGLEDNDDEINIDGEKKEGRKGRINLPWELLQPILRILGHCLMGPEKNEELFQAALCACRCLHARALRDINPKAILATMSLVKLAERAAATGVEVVDYTEIADTMLYSRAFWVSKETIAWDVDAGDGSYFLYGSKNATLSIANGEIQGYDVKFKLEKSNEMLPDHVIEKFPHIQDYKSLQVTPALDVKNLLKYQLAVAALSSSGECTNITGVQLPGVLDKLFSYNGPLGTIFSSEAIYFYLWAPTAQKVHALIYGEPEGGDPLQVVELEESNGVWCAKGPVTLEGYYYVYEVYVYHPSTLRIEKCIANDPYARGLSADGRRTLIVNVDSETLKPEAWDHLVDEKPNLLSFSDISIYELHVRDFSATDNTVPSDCRGGYLAFTSPDSAGMLHLKKISIAGITHVHLLPTFQFAGVHDDKGKWQNVDFQMLESFPPDSEEQQACITAIQNTDGYNWGYNPVLWGVPKGSYASNPNGSCRIIEFRKMVQALNRIGLRVILDVVYNHLHASGPYDEYSVLDKIVPGYYLRRNLDGFIEHSTCTNNTASEHFMVERLIVDDLLHWAVNYKVDGFRFDLMGHIMKRTMVKAKSVLQSLTKHNDGVDGSSIYIYGEGWDFGEVANNGRGVNASQFNLCGTGIGSFNDRIRDAMLGGSPFGHPLQQGFITGLSLEPNDHDHGSISGTEHMLAVSKDHIQVGMAANLKDFVLTNHEGHEVKGSEVSMHDGKPVAYASCPIETVNYVSAHDNETLFDIVSLKTSVNISVDARCRINHLATSIITLSQGIPFFHAGDEILRSKSLDRDSYNSGDWFNRLDFSYSSNNWGFGLPPKEKNERNWPQIKTRLGNTAFKPQQSHILAALENFCSFISIRYSSPLFRLRTSNDIQERVRFHNTGPSWVPGVVVMGIEDGHEGFPGLSQLDPIYSYIVVIINVCPTDITFTSPCLKEKGLQLHPIQSQMSSTDDHIVKNSTYDSSSGSFRVPSRTTSVFVEPRLT